MMMHHTSPCSASRSGRTFLPAAGLLLAALLAPSVAVGANFTVNGNDTAAKTLNAGETGTVNAPSGDLNVSGGTTAINVTGGNVTINNHDLIRQTGTGRAIDANVAGTTLTLINAGTISSVGSNETIRLNQNATLLLTNQLGAVISSNAADALRPGNFSIITNFGTISANPPNVASPAGSDGIDLRTQRTGIVIHNSGTISGRHGIATDGANAGPSSVTVNNNAGGVIFALNGSGLNVDGVSTTATATVTNAFGATIKGGLMSASTEGDGDGIDVDGVLTLNNSGDVLGLGAKGGTNNAEGIAAGGGSITNTATGRIIGSSLLADAPLGDTTRAGNGILIDDSNGGNAVAATTITNAGLIQGKSGFGVKLIGTFADTVTNEAGGLIRGTGPAATLQTGGGDDIVTNTGTIQHDSGGLAVSLEAGNDTLTITGGGAGVTGGMDGGTGTDSLNFNLGSPTAAFTQDGAITNFEHLEIAAGKVQLSGALDLGAAGNSLDVLAGGTLDLADGSLTMDRGSVLMEGVMSFLLSSDTTYGQLRFDAGNLGGLTLSGLSALDLDFGYTPVLGTQFTLVDFLGGSPFLAGTFAGLAEGAVFSQDGLQFQITYQGNEGHDIVLTRTVPDASATLGLLSGGLVLLGLARRRQSTAS